jgi:hypothetical protein
MSVAVSGESITFADSSEQNTAATGFGFKNRIINGAMVIDQRNAGAAVSAAGQTLDRWILGLSTTGSVTVQQDSTVPAGFTKSAKVTVTASDTISGTEYVALRQKIEGFNVADLGWGTASAATVTLSFWVRSSITGTFGGVFLNNAQDRVYPYTYTISSANTFEYKTVTIAGDTTGTWLTNNGTGLDVWFGLGVGSTYSGTAGAWSSSFALSATGAASIMGTDGATFYITGVQLERGSNATSFEFIDYGRQLIQCQRYYQKFSATGSGQVFCSGMMNATTTSRMFIPFLVPLRTNPTALEQSGTASDYALFHGATLTTCSAVPQFVEATVNGGGIQANIASGGTAGNGTLLRAATSSAYLGWSAEL